MVRLLGATINGNLDCIGGSFENANQIALVGDSAKVQGNAFFRSHAAGQFQTNGGIMLPGIDVRGMLSFEGARFYGNGINGLNATNANVGGAFR
jgi:hypothetical protein